MRDVFVVMADSGVVSVNASPMDALLEANLTVDLGSAKRVWVERWNPLDGKMRSYYAPGEWDEALVNVARGDD